MLKSFCQVRATGPCKIPCNNVAHMFNFQLATCRNTFQQVAERVEHVAFNNVAIVWPELANAGPTLLGYVALRCCYRLAGA